MKHTTIKKLQESFVGKICTILTHSTNKGNYNDQQFADFFTGIIDSIDEDGIFVTHLVTKCKSYFVFQNVIGILEEQTINDTDPQYKEVDTGPQKVEPIVKNDSPFIDPDMLSSMINSAH